jgi:hypothetical protein
MARLPYEPDTLHAECCQDVQAALDARSQAPDGHRVVGAALPSFVTTELIEAAVRNTIDLLVKVAGPTITNATLAYKAQIRSVVSQAALQQIDTLIHGLQDAAP